MHRMSSAPLALSLAVAMLAVSQPTFGQDPAGKATGGDDGQLAFNNACRTCHTTREGDNRLGPNLHKIVGRKAGSLPNYAYSSAMKGADLVWDKAALDRFIANPEQVGRGSRQNYCLSGDKRQQLSPRLMLVAGVQHAMQRF
jgi:cytochrome c